MNDLEKITLRDIVRLVEKNRSLLYDITNWKVEGKPGEMLSNFSEIISKVEAILNNKKHE